MRLVKMYRIIYKESAFDYLEMQLSSDFNVCNCTITANLSGSVKMLGVQTF